MSGEPVRRTMDSWIWQPGYPLVSVRRAGDEQAGRKAGPPVEERGGQQVGGRNQGHAGQEGDQAGAEDGITAERR